jgi:hypothetical protein
VIWSDGQQANEITIAERRCSTGSSAHASSALRRLSVSSTLASVGGWLTDHASAAWRSAAAFGSWSQRSLSGITVVVRAHDPHARLAFFRQHMPTGALLAQRDLPVATNELESMGADRGSHDQGANSLCTKSCC